MRINKNILQIGLLYGATIVSLVFGFVISIFTTRLLGPDKFGDFKFFQIVLNLFSVIFSFGVFNSTARLLAHENNESNIKKIYGTNFLIVIALGLSGILSIIVFSFFQGQLFDNDLNLLFRYFSVLFLFLLLKNSLITIIEGSNSIGLLSLLKVIPSGIFLICLFFINSLNLELTASLFYSAMGIGILFIYLKIKPCFADYKSTFQKIQKENKQFGIKVYVGSLYAVSSASLAGLFLSHYLNNKIVGFYSLAMTISLPILMIPSIVGTTFFKKFASATKINNKLLFFTVTISVFSYIIFYFLIEPVVHLFYSKSFYEVINYTRIIAIGYMFHGFGDLFNRFLYAKGMGKLIRNGAIYVGVVNVFGYYFLIQYFGVEGALITKLASSGVYLFFMFLGYIIYIKQHKIS